MRRAAIATGFALGLAAGGAAWAQELSVLGGGMRGGSPVDTTFAWMISYSESLAEHFAASVSWLNEGHIPGHHRDGTSAQLWARARPLGPQLEVGAGVGPYRYFDTTVAESGPGHADEHGTGVLYSVAATWRTAGRWLYELRFNHAETKHSIDSSQLLLGVGYRLDKDERAVYEAKTRRGELALLVGATIVNSLESESDYAEAVSVEYRHAFGPLLRGSIAFMHEGGAQLGRRDGLIAEAWLEPSFYRDAFTLGVGAGAYFATDPDREDVSGTFANGVITLTASVRLAPRWTGRFLWHRIHSNYDRDADILLLGIGCRL